jgi:uncharacterized protein (UPF0335 family)
MTEPVYDLPKAEVARLDGRLDALIRRTEHQLKRLDAELADIRRDIKDIEDEQLRQGNALRRGGVTTS